MELMNVITFMWIQFGFTNRLIFAAVCVEKKEKRKHQEGFGSGQRLEEGARNREGPSQRLNSTWLFDKKNPFTFSINGQLQVGALHDDEYADFKLAPIIFLPVFYYGCSNMMGILIFIFKCLIHKYAAEWIK